jgi:SAM-dependent methyltransferase
MRLRYAACMTDCLRPPPDRALDDWAARVEADREQVERLREVDDPPDFYAPLAERFRLDPRRTDDPTLNALLADAHTEETWLDVGAGGGRYALPLALTVREVVCIEPSAAMIAVLREGMREQSIANLRIVQAPWPLEDAPVAEVALMAHVGYDIADVGPFLDALEASARRRCVAIMAQSATTTVATLFWEPIHGEPRVRLPALPEFQVLLIARGRLPAVRLVDRPPVSFESEEEALEMARRQLWLAEGGQKFERLRQLVRDRLVERDGRYSFDWEPTRVGLITWEPD